MSLRDRLRSISLRQRVTLLFVATGLLASIALSTASYLTARSYILQRRDEVVDRQAFNNAQLIRSQIRNRRSEAFELISNVRTEQGGFAVLHLGPENLYFSQEIRYTQAAFPSTLIESALAGVTARQRFDIDGKPYIGVGVNIADIDVQYFEAFP
ncbi:MAG: hypothetical protein EBY80_03925, partial [Actinobacteria bacterium]|nr:hypothetical protein [Actinomycetota bacterium]